MWKNRSPVFFSSTLQGPVSRMLRRSWQMRPHKNVNAFSPVSPPQSHSVPKEGHFPSAALSLAEPLGALLPQMWLMSDS